MHIINWVSLIGCVLIVIAAAIHHLYHVYLIETSYEIVDSVINEKRVDISDKITRLVAEDLIKSVDYKELYKRIRNSMLESITADLKESLNKCYINCATLADANVKQFLEKAIDELEVYIDDAVDEKFNEKKKEA
jgi:hypothetical protein